MGALNHLRSDFAQLKRLDLQTSPEQTLKDKRVNRAASARMKLLCVGHLVSAIGSRRSIKLSLLILQAAGGHPEIRNVCQLPNAVIPYIATPTSIRHE